MELVFLVLLVLFMASALASGYPVAFALPGSAILTIGLASLTGYLFAGNVSAYFHSGGPIQWLSAGVTNFRGVYWQVERDTLIAIPLFVFMGIMLQRSKIAEDLLVTMAQLFGPVPGGLGISVVFVGALLAATTGIVGATVVAMGLISLPAMMRNKYSNSLSTGIIAASGTLGQIIPPSIVLIILADQLGSAVDQAGTARKVLYKTTTGAFSMPSEYSVASTSAGNMFLGALVPGLLLVALYMVFILGYAMLRPKAAPAVPFEGSYNRDFAAKVMVTLVPPLTLIFIVLGSIIMGIATVNQAGAIGAVGATVMAGYRLQAGHRGAFMPAVLAILSLIAIGVVMHYYPTNIKGNGDPLGIALALAAVAVFLYAVGWSVWRTYKIENTLHGVMVETAKTTALVFTILIGAAMLTASFRAFGGEELVKEFLTGLPGGFWVQFIMVMSVIFVLGFFIDFIEISVVVVPIVAPILLMDPSANITAVWFGVMIGLNIQTSFLTPPFGFALFYLRGVSPPSVKTIEMYRGVIPFIILQLIGLSVVAVTPQLVNYLPDRIALLSETAPPPRNPRLQYCMEKHVFDVYSREGDKIRAAIAEARKLDLTVVPGELKSGLTASFDKAQKSFGLIKAIGRTEKKLDAGSISYRPLHTQVRRLEKRIRKTKVRIRQARQALSRNSSGDLGNTQQKAEISALRAELKSLQASIPANWKSEYKKFTALQRADTNARRRYRRNADNAYEPLQELLTVINAADALAQIKVPLSKLQSQIADKPRKDAAQDVKHVLSKLNRIAGSRRIAKPLRLARRALRRRATGAADAAAKKKALGELAKSVAAYDRDLAWRQQARAQLLPGLQRYEKAIRHTIGLRLQPRLPKKQALEIASCSAVPRDISLYF